MTNSLWVSGCREDHSDGIEMIRNGQDQKIKRLRCFQYNTKLWQASESRKENMFYVWQALQVGYGEMTGIKLINDEQFVATDYVIWLRDLGD